MYRYLPADEDRLQDIRVTIRIEIILRRDTSGSKYIELVYYKIQIHIHEEHIEVRHKDDRGRVGPQCVTKWWQRWDVLHTL